MADAATPKSSPQFLRLRMDVGQEGPTLAIAIPAELSLRVAKMHVIETAVKWLKGPALTEALKKLRQ